MQIYDYAETYNGHNILIKAALYTGIVSGPGDVTDNTHTVTTYLDDVQQFEDANVTTGNLAAAYTSALDAMKAQVDGIDEAAAILLDLGFALDTVVDTPTGFSVVQGDPGESKLNWDVYGPVESYTIQRGLMADHSDLTTISTGDLPEYNDQGPLVSGTTYYYGIKGSIAGMTDSAMAYASVVAP